MQLKTLCLGLLDFSDATGYDIKRMFEYSLNHFHAASFGSIYPALKQLEEEGHVSSYVEPGERHPDRRLFRLTSEGRQHFIDALSGTEPSETLKSEFLVLLFFAHLLETEELEEKLAAMEQRYDAKIAELESLSDPDCHRPGIQFTIEFGIAAMQARRDFIRKHRDDLLATHQDPVSKRCKGYRPKRNKE